MERKITIIGAGIVGTAIGHLLRRKGYCIVAVAGRSMKSLKKAQAYTGGMVMTDVAEAAKAADTIFLTTNDDQIKDVCLQIAERDGFQKGDAVFHMSGALSTEILRPARDAGAGIGCIHPLQSFADIEGAIENLPGSTFGLTAEESLLPLARQLVEALNGEAILIEDKDKPVYHAGACIACNYLVALVHYTQELYRVLGIQPETAIKALWPLITGTLANIERKGTAAALTGPIARGDLGTIKRHLEALGSISPGEADLYRELGKYTIKVARQKGGINQKQEESMKRILSKAENKNQKTEDRTERCLISEHKEEDCCE
jgi:predicted short-subunit dehydrogenase-like oxidoreductase (DUF2520 family)